MYLNNQDCYNARNNTHSTRRRRKRPGIDCTIGHSNWTHSNSQLTKGTQKEEKIPFLIKPKLSFCKNNSPVPEIMSDL